MESHETTWPSRRQLLSSGTAAGVKMILGSSSEARGAVLAHPESGVQNVRDFGAAGDAVSDDTEAFQRALDAVAHAGGGTVYSPPGKYPFKGTINFPGGVTLRGPYTSVPSHAVMRNQGVVKPGVDGTALLARAGRGNENGAPFLTLNTNSSIAGLTIFYPERVTGSVLPCSSLTQNSPRSIVLTRPWWKLGQLITASFALATVPFGNPATRLQRLPVLALWVSATVHS